MKRLLYLSFIIALFSNCHNNNKSIRSDRSKTTAATSRLTKQLIQKFGAIINGSWVRADYIEKIRRTKSPLAATDLVDWITAIDISIDSLRGDSIVALAGYGNHDSGNVTIKFKPGKRPSSILFNGDDLTYTIEKGDTLLLLPEEQPHGVDHEALVRFMKVHVKHREYLGSGIDQLVNEALIAGNYTITDSLATIEKIRFDIDGKITGFLNFNHYAINIDLNDDPRDNLDEIFFSQSTKGPSKGYAYKISNDTIKLYTTRVNADSTEDILDKLKYTLVRKK